MREIRENSEIILPRKFPNIQYVSLVQVLATDSETVVHRYYSLQSLKKNFHGCEHTHTYSITGELVFCTAHTIYMLLTAEGKIFTIRKTLAW